MAPVKIHVARQPFDPINRILIDPKLYAPEPGSGAFWKDFDWTKATETGMRKVGLPFSGKVAFIETVMYWPLNHMVSPKEQSLSCDQCHSRKTSRLANLTDFYLPGRDYHPLIETAGQWLILFSLGGIFLHGSLRIIFALFTKRRGKNG